MPLRKSLFYNDLRPNNGDTKKRLCHYMSFPVKVNRNNIVIYPQTS